jgi:hypothetical protein
MNSNAVLTRLVVGQSFTLDLGVPVGRQLADRVGEVLHWRAGRWVDATATEDGGARVPVPASAERPAAAVKAGAAMRPMSQGRWWRVSNPAKWALAAIAGSAALGALAWVSLQQTSSSYRPTPAPRAAPSVPAPATPTSSTVPSAPVLPVPAAGPEVRLVSHSYEPAMIATTVGRPLPIAPKDLTAAVVGDSKLPRPATTQAAAEPRAANVEKAPAVVLDEGSKQTPNLPAATRAASAPQQPAAGPRPVALVAITPDGKAAVFANPSTRLPEQFRLGDRLPSGETIRSIDPKLGKVMTSSREYGLE